MIVAISCSTYLSPLLLFLSASHIKLQQWSFLHVSNYFMNLLHEQLYFPLHKFWSMAAVQYVVTSIFLNILPWTFRVPSIHILHWSILAYAQVTYLFGILCCKYTYLLIQTYHNVEHLYIQDFLGSLYVILCVWICMSMYVCLYICTYTCIH